MSYIKPFFFGILAAISALVLEQAAFIFIGDRMETEIAFKISWILVVSAMIEEALKYLLLYKNSAELNGKKEIIVSSFFLGLGFAMTEILLYLSGQNIVWQSAAWPLLGVLFVHLITSGYAGYLLAKKQNVYVIAIRALIFNILLHLLYNFAVLNIF